jgi:hypothetical protein
VWDFITNGVLGMDGWHLLEFGTGYLLIWLFGRFSYICTVREKLFRKWVDRVLKGDWYLIS